MESPAQPGQSGVARHVRGRDNRDKTANGNKIQVWGCNGSAAREVDRGSRAQYAPAGRQVPLGDGGSPLLDGAVVLPWNRAEPTRSNQQWVVGPTGDLINVNSGRCLDDPGNSTTEGTALVQEDCYGQPGEIWALT